jgi:hypothetical protein
MTLQDFHRLLRARPFQPFRVITSSGERYEVRHPEVAFLTRTNLVIGLAPDSQGTAEDWTIVSLLHVAAIEPLKGQPPRRRRRSA